MSLFFDLATKTPNLYYDLFYKALIYKTFKLKIQLERDVYIDKKLNIGSRNKDFHHFDYSSSNEDKKSLVFVHTQIHHSVINHKKDKKIQRGLKQKLKDLLNGDIPRN